jgi:translation elongation factor EF-G
VTTLRSITPGRATFSMEFMKYAEVTPEIKDYIMNVGRFIL